MNRLSRPPFWFRRITSGPVIQLCIEKRGIQKNLLYHGRQAMLTYELPLNEVVLDFFDRLKSVSRGYASFDYDFLEFRATDLVKLDVLINGDKVDAHVGDRASRTVAIPWTRSGFKIAGTDSTADVRRRHPGGDRLENHRA